MQLLNSTHLLTKTAKVGNVQISSEMRVSEYNKNIGNSSDYTETRNSCSFFQMKKKKKILLTRALIDIDLKECDGLILVEEFLVEGTDVKARTN